MLVVAAVYLDRRLRPLVPYDRFWQIMGRTLTLFAHLAPLAPVYAIHYNVLQQAANQVQLKRHREAV
jgi:hypothetical protein